MYILLYLINTVSVSIIENLVLRSYKYIYMFTSS